MAPQHYGLLTFAAAFGYELGGFFSFDLFLLLNSDEFCINKLGLS